MTQPLAGKLEGYRPLLRLEVRKLQLDPRLRRRFDSSDLVQEAFVRALTNLDQFAGKTEGEWVKWLQCILKNAAIDADRREKADKRDLRAEQYLEDCMTNSSVRLAKFLEDNGSSPSQQVERGERYVRFAEALERLPEDQRDVVIQRDLLGLPVDQIAREADRTEKSVAGLLRRGRQGLRELLQGQW